MSRRVTPAASRSSSVQVPLFHSDRPESEVGSEAVTIVVVEGAIVCNKIDVKIELYFNGIIYCKRTKGQLLTTDVL